MTKSPVKRVLVTAFAVLIISSHGATHQGTTPPENQVQTLVPGAVIPRQMGAGAKDVYKLTLEAQQFAQIIVEQKGIDVGVNVAMLDGSPYMGIDSPNGLYGPETVSILAPVAATYVINISSSGTLPAGDYELRIKGPHVASESDAERVKAERLFNEGQELRTRTRGLSPENVKEKFFAAIEKYKEAIALFRKLGDLRAEGYSLTNTARVYRSLAQLTKPLDPLRNEQLDHAFSHFGEALSRLREAPDISGQAFVLNETGSTHRDLGDPLEAITSYEAVLQLRLNLGDRYGQAQVYNNLGLTYSNMGYQPSALQHHEKALPIWRELNVRHDEMNTNINVAKAYVEMGDLTAALSKYQEVFNYCETELKKENSSLKWSAGFLMPFALNGIGLVNDTWADADVALAHYRQALKLFSDNYRDREQADVLDNMGMAYAFLGDPHQALDHFRKSLVIRERLNEPKGLGATLSNTGYAYTLLNDHEEALRYLALALPLTERARDKRFQAYTLVRMGMAQVNLKRPANALEIYERALAIQQEAPFMDQRGQAITLDKMGEALGRVGDWAQALNRYEQAIEHWRTVKDGQGEALSLYGMARIESEQQNLANARDYVERALNIVEQLRNRVSSRQLQMTYFAGKHNLYALAVDVRMRLYELTKSPANIADMEAALSISERGRARSLLDLLTEARADFPKRMSSEDAENSARLERQISELTQALLRFRSIGAKQDAAFVERTLATRIREHDNLLALARRAGTAIEIGTRQARPLTSQGIQQLLDDNTMLLQYSLDEARSHLWTITRTSIHHYSLAGEAEINKAVSELRKALTKYEPKRNDESNEQYLERFLKQSNQHGPKALTLSRMVLGGVWSKLGDKRLVIVADGGLQYIPFEILPIAEPAQPAEQSSSGRITSTPTLVSTNEVVYQPSASTLGLLRDVRRPRPSKTVAVFANPVFDNTDERVRSSLGVPSVKPASLERSVRSWRDVGDQDFNLEPLEYSLKEATSIIAVARRGSWMVEGFEANRAAVTSPTLKQFRIVHFATHGIINDRHPELSGIVLSLVNQRGEDQEGYLTLRDICHLDLPVQLVVVSACSTGIGQQVPGEGLIGLTRGFMNAGAQSVVVSLWRVEDEATAELMKHFYRHMFGRNKLSPPAALRQAKREMQAYPKWRAPYYWAGFVLQGDWK